VAVQVNGKTRGKVLVTRGANQETALAAALADPAIRKFVDGKEIKKVIYVPDRLINIVVG
jgi:leucyl-tRNA synthetase